MKLPLPHRCARCGTVIPRHMLWGLSWSADKWKCPGCGTLLMVDLDRRSNLTFVSTVFICSLLALCFTWSWSVALLVPPGLAAIWALDRPVVAEEPHHS